MSPHRNLSPYNFIENSADILSNNYAICYFIKLLFYNNLLFHKLEGKRKLELPYSFV